MLKIHARHCLTNKSIGVIIRTVKDIRGTYSGFVRSGGSAQPDVFVSNRPNREACVKACLRIVARTWIGHNEQEAIDRRTIANVLTFPIDAQSVFELQMTQLDSDPIGHRDYADEDEIIEMLDYESATVSLHDDSNWVDSYNAFTGRELTLTDL